MGLEIPTILNTQPHPEYTNQEKHEVNLRNVEKNIKAEVKKEIADINIHKALKVLRQTANIFNKRLKFHINKDIGRVVVKVIDTTTDKVIKEIPPQEIQKLIARLKATIGLLVDEKI